MVTLSFTRWRAAALIVTLVFAVALVSCGSPASSSKEPSLGIAYVGPASMHLREDLALKSAPVVEVKHGDRLEILETRRRLVRVRTAQGTEGWADANLLMSAEQMDDLQRMAGGAEKYPSQGRATVFDALNMHTEPSRISPSFAQIPEGGSVEVLSHRATPRVTSAKALPLRKAAKLPAKPAKKDAKKAAAALLPPPSAPPPRPDWQKISRPQSSDLPGYEAPVVPPPPPLEDWALVRAKDGKVGWVLARQLSMAIPDEVAQYAEGKRITAYLAIGEVKDGDEVKQNWLWTTAASDLKLSEFDSIRVFVWSAHRHRYETAYIERNVTGYYPVQLADIPGDKEKGFSLLAEDKDGTLMKRVYAFSGYHVRLVSKTPVAKEEEKSASALNSGPGAGSDSAASTGWWQKMTALPRRWLSR